MKVVVLVALLGASATVVHAGQARRGTSPPPAPQGAPDRKAQAYEQFLRAHLFEDEDTDTAIAAYKRAIELDPTAPDIPADLAELYLRENKGPEAIQYAEMALKIDKDHRDAHRVLGTVYASMASGSRRGGGVQGSQRENLTKAITHLEQSIEPPMSAADANQRAMLARLYIAAESYEKAIPVLSELVKQEPGWSDGPMLLTDWGPTNTGWFRSGREHKRDRHNAGWMIVDELARRHDGSFRSKFSGQLTEVRVGESKLALLKPETYMNLSGNSLAAAARFFKLPTEQIAVVHDEVDLEPGRIQVRLGGGLAGHNGLRSIRQALGSAEFLRVRVGVGRPGRGDRRPVADYVLSPFAPEDDAEALISRSADAVETLTAEGLDEAQRRFN